MDQYPKVKVGKDFQKKISQRDKFVVKFDYFKINATDDKGHLPRKKVLQG